MRPEPRLMEAVAAIRDLLEGDDDLILLRDSLEGETSLFEVADAMLENLLHTEALASALKTQIGDARSRLTRLERRGEALRDGLRTLTAASGLPTIERPRATLSLAKAQEAVRFASDFDCPSQLLKRPPPPEPDTAEIKRQLKAGVAIDGAWLERGPAILKIGRT